MPSLVNIDAGAGLPYAFVGLAYIALCDIFRKVLFLGWLFILTLVR